MCILIYSFFSQHPKLSSCLPFHAHPAPSTMGNEWFLEWKQEGMKSTYILVVRSYKQIRGQVHPLPHPRYNAPSLILEKYFHSCEGGKTKGWFFLHPGWLILQWQSLPLAVSRYCTYSTFSPRHRTKKNMLKRLAHKPFFWPGWRKKRDLFVLKVRNKVSGGCDLWQK